MNTNPIKKLELATPCTIEVFPDGAWFIRPASPPAPAAPEPTALETAVPTTPPPEPVTPETPATTSQEATAPATTSEADSAQEPDPKPEPSKAAADSKAKKREQNRLRQRRHRERLRVTRDVTPCHAPVTQDVTHLSRMSRNVSRSVTQAVTLEVPSTPFPPAPQGVTPVTRDTPSSCCCYLKKNKQQQEQPTQQEINPAWKIPELLDVPEFREAWQTFRTWRHAHGGARSLKRGEERHSAESCFLQDLEELANIHTVAAALLVLEDTQRTGWVNRLHIPPVAELREAGETRALEIAAKQQQERLTRCAPEHLRLLQRAERTGSVEILRASPNALRELEEAFSATHDTATLEAWDAMWTPLHADLTFLTDWDTLDTESQQRVLAKLRTTTHGGVVILSSTPITTTQPLHGSEMVTDGLCLSYA